MSRKDLFHLNGLKSIYTVVLILHPNLQILSPFVAFPFENVKKNLCSRIQFFRKLRESKNNLFYRGILTCVCLCQAITLCTSAQHLNKKFIPSFVLKMLNEIFQCTFGSTAQLIYISLKNNSQSNSDCICLEVQTQRFYYADFPYSSDFICTYSLKKYVCIHSMGIGTLLTKTKMYSLQKKL